jgi:hypothetical protein
LKAVTGKTVLLPSVLEGMFVLTAEVVETQMEMSFYLGFSSPLWPPCPVNYSIEL